MSSPRIFDLAAAAAKDPLLRVRKWSVLQLFFMAAAVGLGAVNSARLALGLNSAPLWSFILPFVVAAAFAICLAVSLGGSSTGNVPVKLEVSASMVRFVDVKGRQTQIAWSSLDQPCQIERPVPFQVWDQIKGDWRAPHFGEKDNRWGPGGGEPPPAVLNYGKFHADLTDDAYSAILDSARGAGLEVFNPYEIREDKWHYLLIRPPKDRPGRVASKTTKDSVEH